MLKSEDFATALNDGPNIYRPAASLKRCFSSYEGEVLTRSIRSKSSRALWR